MADSVLSLECKIEELILNQELRIKLASSCFETVKNNHNWNLQWRNILETAVIKR